MKLGDMTFKQIAEICVFPRCNQCPLSKDDEVCILLDQAPSYQDLNMVVKTVAEMEKELEDKNR